MSYQVQKEDFVFLDQRENKEFESMRPSITYWQDAKRRLFKNKVAVFSLILLTLIILLCVFVPVFSPYEYEVGDLTIKNQRPSAEHWFGTDKLGRDIFTRVFIGGRVSLIVGFVGAFIDVAIGLTYGGISAYFGGKVDTIMMRIIEVLNSIPYLVQVILISLILGQGILPLIVAMTLTGWCFTARLVRGQILQIKSADYVLASKALGTSPAKIIAKHMIPNTIGVVIVAITFDIPSFIFGEAFLSYIGLGIQSPMTSWGSLASSAQTTMTFYPYQLFFPALLISLTMLSFQLLGDGLRDALDPSMRV